MSRKTGKTRRKIIISCLILAVISISAMFIGWGLFNSYNGSNLSVRFKVWEEIAEIYPDLKYDLDLSEFYVGQNPFGECYIWKYKVECDGDDQNYYAYVSVRKVDHASFSSVFEYAAYYFDYDENLYRKIDSECGMKEYRDVNCVAGNVYRPEYEIYIYDEEEAEAAVAKLDEIYKKIGENSKGELPVNIMITVNCGDDTARFYSNRFFGKYTDKHRDYTDEERLEYIRTAIGKLMN